MIQLNLPFILLVLAIGLPVGISARSSTAIGTNLDVEGNIRLLQTVGGDDDDNDRPIPVVSGDDDDDDDDDSNGPMSKKSKKSYDGVGGKKGKKSKKASKKSTQGKKHKKDSKKEMKDKDSKKSVKKGKKEKYDDDDDDNSSMMPSVAPTGCPRQPTLLERLSNITDEQILLNLSTPQGLAFDWLVNSDTSTDVCKYATIEQRYAMSTLYYSTKGDDWKNNTGWLGEGNECTWSSATCNDQNLLTILLLESNNLNGQIPSEFSLLSNLEDIIFFDNKMSGPLPDISNLKGLKKFDVEKNSFVGPAFSSLSELLLLESYLLSDNELTGSIPEDIGKLTELKNFWIIDNKISGSIPKDISQAIKLEKLFIGKNDITGTIPPEMDQLVDMTQFFANDNKLTGTVPNSMLNRTMLEQLRIHNNKLNGTFPEINIESLKDLRIHKNEFTGTLPSTLANAEKIVNLLAGDNSFSGPLPSIGTPSLRFFDVRNNDLVGTIPDSLFESPVNLTNVYIQGNELTGGIPGNFSSANKLSDFFTSNNTFSGAIPEIPEGSLPALTEFLLDNNNFTGSMPTSICNLRNGVLEDLWVDCTPPAKVVCEIPTCCTRCFPIEE